jgi:hypothetical protein
MSSGTTVELPKPKFDVDIGFDSHGRELKDSPLLEDLAKRAKNGKKLRQSLLFALRDFAPYAGTFLINRSCRIEELELPSPSMVFILLVRVAGNSFAGRFEKVAWSVAFSFKGTPYAFSLEKFGLRLYHHKNSSPPKSEPAEMLKCLKYALPIVDKLFAPLVLEQVSAGNVPLANNFIDLENMYSKL